MPLGLCLHERGRHPCSERFRRRRRKALDPQLHSRWRNASGPRLSAQCVDMKALPRACCACDLKLDLRQLCQDSGGQHIVWHAVLSHLSCFNQAFWTFGSQGAWLVSSMDSRMAPTVRQKVSQHLGKIAGLSPELHCGTADRPL